MLGNVVKIFFHCFFFLVIYTITESVALKPKIAILYLSVSPFSHVSIFSIYSEALLLNTYSCIIDISS